MSVDTVNYALTNVRLRILRYPEHYSPEGQRKLLAMCDVMRSYLMEEDVASFNGYINCCLATEPDATDFLLEELYGEVGLDCQTAVREDLDAALAAA